jgi:hypothetical protein
MPLVIGETDLVNPDGSYDSRVVTDTAGEWLRQMAWAQSNASRPLTLTFTSAGEAATANGNWAKLAHWQAFMAGMPLANGNYRDCGATASTPSLIVRGESDLTNRRAYFTVRNRAEPAPAQSVAIGGGLVAHAAGSVNVPMPDGSYTVESWDTGAGTFTTSPATVSGGTGLILSVSVLSVAGFKVYPAS